jgi:hypothetical protein
MNGTPLKEPRRKKSPTDHLKKPKPKISAGAAKALLGIRSTPDVPWIERHLEDLCRTNSWPLQIICSDAISKLGELLGTQAALAILEKLRTEYKTTHPHILSKEDFTFLNTTTES